MIRLLISSGDTNGDACIEDFDGDGVHDKEDVCPTNPKITRTDFSVYQTIAIDSVGSEQHKPFWKVNKKVMYSNTLSGVSVSLGAS